MDEPRPSAEVPPPNNGNETPFAVTYRYTPADYRQAMYAIIPGQLSPVVWQAVIVANCLAVAIVALAWQAPGPAVTAIIAGVAFAVLLAYITHVRMAPRLRRETALERTFWAYPEYFEFRRPGMREQSTWRGITELRQSPVRWTLLRGRSYAGMIVVRDLPDDQAVEYRKRIASWMEADNDGEPNTNGELDVTRPPAEVPLAGAMLSGPAPFRLRYTMNEEDVLSAWKSTAGMDASQFDKQPPPGRAVRPRSRFRPAAILLVTLAVILTLLLMEQSDDVGILGEVVRSVPESILALVAGILAPLTLIAVHTRWIIHRAARVSARHFAGQQLLTADEFGLRMASPKGVTELSHAAITAVIDAVTLVRIHRTDGLYHFVPVNAFVDDAERADFVNFLIARAGSDPQEIPVADLADSGETGNPYQPPVTDA
jgi:hypothetical protein